MIRNQWYVVLKSTEVGKKPVGVTRMGEKLVFWRGQGGEVQCMRDQCPHLGAPLHLGKVVDGALQCPFHGFEFDPGGQCRHIPALGRSGDIPRAMRAGGYFTYEAEGFIWIFMKNIMVPMDLWQEPQAQGKASFCRHFCCPWQCPSDRMSFLFSLLIIRVAAWEENCRNCRTAQA